MSQYCSDEERNIISDLALKTTKDLLLEYLKYLCKKKVNFHDDQLLLTGIHNLDPNCQYIFFRHIVFKDLLSLHSDINDAYRLVSGYVN